MSGELGDTLKRMPKNNPGLYANIHKKRKSGKPMRKKGAKGAPTDADFRKAAKTAKKKKR